MNAPDAADTMGQRFAGWLVQMVDAEASDLHIVVGHPPVLRVHGEMQPIDTPPLDSSEVAQLLMAVCPEELSQRFRAEKNVDFSLERTVRDQLRRFRANYFLSLGVIGACFRLFPATIPDFQWAGFPVDLAHKLAHFRNGLVLLTGVAGSGKTTTLAMLIELLNREGGYRIITIEEPVEYVFSRNPKTVITQREVGLDVHSFAAGLKYALRQDPNIILVGEIRDRDTAQMALQRRRDRPPCLLHHAHARRQRRHLPLY